jgi:hypothetical protein
LLYTKKSVWENEDIIENKNDVNLVTVFGDTEEFIKPEYYDYLKERYPKANILGCSSSGNVSGSGISDCSLVVNAVSFDKSIIVLKYVDFELEDDIKELSKQLVGMFDTEGLKHLFLLADGLNLNGSHLVEGINQTLDIPMTGGLAGDGDRFEKTLVIANAPAKQKRIAALGFYGNNLHIGTGSFGGWSEFGTQRKITKSKENILYEIDGEPALDFYKRYLGEYADELPNSGLRFPLSIKENDNYPETIRTLMAIDENEKSITFAGNVPEGYTARLMKPNIDLLIDGAGQAAEIAKIDNQKTALALVVSCVGRKIVMGQLIDEELEAVAKELGDNVHLTGFYSYGEIAPFENEIKSCQLHNQTMTLTVIYED